MPITLSTIADLRDARNALAAGRRAQHALTSTDINEQTLRALDLELDKLEARVLTVGVPCLLCKATFPVAAHVGDPDRGEPNSVICEDCDARI